MANQKKLTYSPGREAGEAGDTAISCVRPEPGLIYRGYDIEELAENASYEEIVWLLLHGELPKMSELAALTRQLVEDRPLPAAVVNLLGMLPPGTHPMDSLRTG